MIYLLCSTIRPEVFKKTHEYWMEQAHDKSNIKTKLVVDSRLDLEQLCGFDVILYTGDSIGLTKPLYKLTKSLTGLNDDDIVVVMSDDFFPPKHWDKFLLEQFDGFNGALNVFDGGVPEVQKTIITIPIMSYSCLKKLNHIVYHPIYNHMFSDNELFDILTELKILKTIGKDAGYTFEHRHWTKSGRVKDKHDESVGAGGVWIADQVMYKSRKKLSISKKLECDFTEPPLLSILICTVESRKPMLDNLLKNLLPQVTERVQILIGRDHKDLEKDMPSPTIGKKRNTLLQSATGKYVCFIDDDDLVTPDYVSSILRAAEYNTDCIALSGVMFTDGKNPKFFTHSLQHRVWEEVNGKYLRCPNHLNSIKRSIALKVGFNADKSFEEDKEFSEKILPHLKSEYYLSNILYLYLFSTNQKEYHNVLTK